jgi:peptidoglycan/xylan/chitin deacetylase (PgdA/CDA1 family)
MTPAMSADLRSGRVKSWYDRDVVRILRRTRTPATIFLTGLWTKTYPGAVRSFARDPLFELENHS